MRFSNWQDKATAIWLLVLVIIALVLGVAWLKKDIHIESNIFALLPKTHKDVQLEQAQQYVSDQLNSKVFVVLDASSNETLQIATQMLKQEVDQSGLFEPLKPQFDSESFGKNLYQHKIGLLTKSDQQFLLNKDYDALAELSMLQFMSPGIPLTGNLLKEDPFLFFPRYVMSLAGLNQSNIEFEDGFSRLKDEHLISQLVILSLKESPYNIDYQEKSSLFIERVNQKLLALGVKPHWTGTLLFAQFGTNSAKNEISTIGVGSTLGILLLVWFGFRSVRPMVTEMVAVSTGCLVAFAITYWVFGEIHLMTLVFGASLIGVCVDFSFYFMAMQSQHRHIDGFTVLRPVLPSLFIGLLTTLMAYAVLSFTPFPGFKQIAVFSMVGLCAAWITSILLLPRLPALNAEPAIRTLAFIGNIRSYVQAKKSLRNILIFGILLITGSSLFFLKSNDDIRNLQSMDQKLKLEDQYIRDKFVQQQGGEYFVVHGKTPTELLRNEQNLIQQLQKLKDQHKLVSFQALGQWLPSEEEQRKNIELLVQIPNEILARYADATQLDIQDLQSWQARLKQQPILDFQGFSAHPLTFLQMNPTTRLIMLQNIQDMDAIKHLETANTQLLRPVSQLSELFKIHRIHAQWLVLVALGILVTGLGLFYGRRAILPLVLPVTMALMTTFAIQVWLGVEINLFSIMGSFLIVGIGVDYAIFYYHGHDHPQVVGMALFLCMMSTFLGFGLLSFSQTYAIHCFGLTVLLGVVFAFIYATLFTSSDEKHVVIQQYHSKN